MMSNLIELQPNRLLLDSNFDGYKLSLREISTKRRTFENTVDRILLTSNQNSILHAKLFGLHNHLVGDDFDENGSVYFVDKDWSVNKVYFDSLCDELSDPIKVWQVPKNRERTVKDYNITMKFISADMVVVGDGMGFLYILQTGCRDNDDKFILCFSEEVAGPNEAFVIVDAVYNRTRNDQELHVLLLSIKQEKPNERHFCLLHWITLTLKNGIWGQTALKQFKIKGVVQYAAVEKECEAVYLISDGECEIVLNSDNPVSKHNEYINIDIKSSYEWSQTTEDISISIEMSDEASKDLVYVISTPTEITVKYDQNTLISGPLYKRIDSDLTTWTLEKNKLNISLYKQETGIIWPNLNLNDIIGKHIVESCVVNQLERKFSDLINEEEAIPQAGTTFSSQQVEECDFENDKTTIFERISGTSNESTHKINLGSHQVLMTAQLNGNLPPAIGIRYDVDICLWQPDFNENTFSINHEGTLLALGYVQASKQNRKFLVSPPTMEYSAICESSGHIFIYRQKKSISSSELRNRTTGRRINNIAEQQVLNVTNDEILGIYPCYDKLFLLCEKYAIVLKL